ncbi:tRNA wybutosine-synthesizing protein 3 homolog [Synchiropus picturatus]
MEKNFSQWKKQCLNKLDLSLKGSVDQDIAHIVSLLNGCDEFFTTSSCSGRITIIDSIPDSSGIQKQNCAWLFVSHAKCTLDDLMASLDKSTGDAVLKFEPFVLHVQCRSLEDAQLMHSVAVESGFRNSGLTIGKTGKIITAVRCTHGLEVPLTLKGDLLVSHQYIDFLCHLANAKMEENFRRIDRFYQNLQSSLASRSVHKHDPPQALEPEVSPDSRAAAEGDSGELEKRSPTSVYRRRRKQRQQTDGCHGDSGGSTSVSELDDCLDLFA